MLTIDKETIAVIPSVQLTFHYHEMTLVSVDHVAVGQPVSGTSIQADTLVTAVNVGKSLVSLSKPPTAAIVGGTYTFQAVLASNLKCTAPATGHYLSTDHAYVCSAQLGCATSAAACTPAAAPKGRLPGRALMCATAAVGWHLVSSIPVRCTTQPGCLVNGGACSATSGHTTQHTCTATNNGYYLVGDISTACAVVTNAQTITCTDGTATKVLKCKDGYYKGGTYSAGSSSNTCTLCTSQGTFEKVASASSGATTLTLTDFGDVSVGQPLTGAGVASGTTVASFTSFAQEGHGAQGSTSITLDDSGSPGTCTSCANVAVGQAVTGEGIEPGTTVAAIAGTALTLSKPTLDFISGFGYGDVTGVGPFTQDGAAASSSTAVTLDSGGNLAKVAVGMEVTGSGIAAGTSVAAISTTALTLSLPTTATLASGTTLSFTSRHVTLGAAQPKILVGMFIGAPGELADGCRIQRVQGTLLTLTKPLLADMANTNVLLQTFSQTGTAASGDYTVTLVDPFGVTVGASVFASAGLPAWPSGTHVTAISGNIVTLNVAFTAALSSAWIAFVATNGVLTFAGNDATISGG